MARSEKTASETAAQQTDGAEGSPAEPDLVLGRPVVVLDEVEMTYTVRSITSAPAQRGLGRLFQRASGVQTSHVQALHPISLIVRQGESVGVIGTNGSGKSTLMKVITGQLQPTGGSVYAASVPIMLGVNAALVPQVSGEDNITLGCLAMGMSRAEARAKYDSIVELSGLAESLHLPLRAYSSGMAARLQFAIATSVDPEILVIDEALNTGDAQFRAKTGRRLDELREQAGCVFLVSHSLSTIQQMCSRVIWVEKGVLVMDGAPADVTRKYTRYTHHLGKGRPHDAQAVLEEGRAESMLVRIEWAGNEPREGS